jgi:hypothetical protein
MIDMPCVDNPPGTAKSAIVGLIGGRQVRVHCGGSGSTDFALDVLGYHR